MGNETLYTKKIAALERELRELGEKISKGCLEMKALIDSGMMDRQAVDEQFDWLWTLKSRRIAILGALGLRRSRGADRDVD